MDTKDPHAEHIDLADMSTHNAREAFVVQTRTQVPLPPLLRHLSDEERQKFDTSVKRKIDLRLLPMMLLMYIMNYLDRNNIAAAKLAGLSEDLNLKANEYQLSVSILFVGYLLMQGMPRSLQNRGWFH